VKILLLIETLTAGGAETFVLRLANALSARNEVTVAVMHGGLVDQRLADQLRPAVRLKTLQTPAERWWWRADRLLRALRLDISLLRARQRRWLMRLLEEFRPDIIHSHLLKADRLMLEVASGRQVGRVTTLHGDYEPYLQGQADPQMLDPRGWIRRALAEADAVVGVCEAHRQTVLRLAPHVGSRLQLIYNGYEPVEAPAPAWSPDGLFRFGMVSRGVALKGWRHAAEAFARIGNDRSRLVLVGEGPAIAELRAERRAHVECVGFNAQPTEWIAKFDVCLLPTLFPHESLPTVVVEYLACGKPVIATDVGEIRAMLTAPDGRMAGTLLSFNGYDVDVEELARPMAALRDNAEARAAMGQAALTAFERFRMEHCVEAYERLYSKVAAERVSPPLPAG